MEVGHPPRFQIFFFFFFSLVDDRQQGELLGRIKSVRKKFAQGRRLPCRPVVHIRDNLELNSPNTYVITLEEVARLVSCRNLPREMVSD